LPKLSLVHGTTVGNIVEHAAPKVQIINPKPVEEDKKKFIEADLVFVPDAGDDEYRCTIR